MPGQLPGSAHPTKPDTRAPPPTHLHHLDRPAGEAMARSRQRLALVPPHHPAIHVLAGGPGVAPLLLCLVCRPGQSGRQGGRESPRVTACQQQALGGSAARSGRVAAGPAGSTGGMQEHIGPGRKAREESAGGKHGRKAREESTGGKRLTLQRHIVGGDAVPPPQLPRHAPVPDVLHPPAAGGRCVCVCVCV